MIVDVRTYTLIPRKQAKYLELFEKRALPVTKRHGLELMSYHSLKECFWYRKTRLCAQLRFRQFANQSPYPSEIATLEIDILVRKIAADENPR
jgi:hypothetical protein